MMFEYCDVFEERKVKSVSKCFKGRALTWWNCKLVDKSKRLEVDEEVQGEILAFLLDAKSLQWLVRSQGRNK